MLQHKVKILLNKIKILLNSFFLVIADLYNKFFFLRCFDKFFSVSHFYMLNRENANFWPFVQVCPGWDHLALIQAHQTKHKKLFSWMTLLDN
jgi:hypothetical protein